MHSNKFNSLNLNLIPIVALVPTISHNQPIKLKSVTLINQLNQSIKFNYLDHIYFYFIFFIRNYVE